MPFLLVLTFLSPSLTFLSPFLAFLSPFLALPLAPPPLPLVFRHEHPPASQTFENIADASATAFQLLVAQNTMSVDEMLPASPPLYALTIPYDLFTLARCGIKRMGVGSAADPTDGEDGDGDNGSFRSSRPVGLQRQLSGFQVLESPSLPSASTCFDYASPVLPSASTCFHRASTMLPVCLPSGFQVTSGEHATRVMFQQRQIEEYSECYYGTPQPAHPPKGDAQRTPRLLLTLP